LKVIALLAALVLSLGEADDFAVKL